jgi:hypothetical protein
MEGDRSPQAMSTDGGVPQRWRLVSSAPRRPQAQRLVDQDGLQQRAAEAQALQPLGRTADAWAAAAPHALPTLAPALQATLRHQGTVPPTPRDRRRGRPRPDTPPARRAYHSTGALASSLAAHEALIAPHRGGLLATNDLDERP